MRSFRSRSVFIRKIVLKNLAFLCSLWKKDFTDTFWRTHFPSGETEYSQPLAVAPEKCRARKKSLFCEVKKIALHHSDKPFIDFRRRSGHGSTIFGDMIWIILKYYLYQTTNLIVYIPPPLIYLNSQALL